LYRVRINRQHHYKTSYQWDGVDEDGGLFRLETGFLVLLLNQLHTSLRDTAQMHHGLLRWHGCGNGVFDKLLVFILRRHVSRSHRIGLAGSL